MEKKHIVINPYLIILVLSFFAFLAIFIYFVTHNDVGYCILTAAIVLFHVFTILISPLYFVFSYNDVKIVYTFWQKETIEWCNIRNITSTGSLSKGGSKGLPRYVIDYSGKKKHAIVVGEIPKTAKITKLINEHYHREIMYRRDI